MLYNPLLLFSILQGSKYFCKWAHTMGIIPKKLCSSYQLLSSGKWSTGIQQITRDAQYFKGHYARLFALEEWQWWRWQQAYTNAKDPATSTAAGDGPGLRNSHQIPTADVKIKLPQALQNIRATSKISSEVSIPGQTIEVFWTSIKILWELHPKFKIWRNMQLLWALLKGIFLTWYPWYPIPGKAKWVKASAAQFFHCLWKHTPASTMRLYKPVQQFNSFLGTSILWTLSNQLLKASDLCSQPWKASCALLKWRLWHGRGEAELPPTAHKQHLPFPPTLPTARLHSQLHGQPQGFPAMLL